VTIADRIGRFQSRAQRGQLPTGFVALVNGAVVGLACLVACDLDSHRHLTPWLASVLVEPPYRHQGIGAALSQRTVEEARSLGFTRVYLFTLDQIPFYSRLGWSLLESARFRDHPVTVMERAILE